MIKTAMGIARQEGVLKLWTGLMPMFQRHAIYSGCRLIFYEQFREMLKDDKGKVSLASASIGELWYHLKENVVVKNLGSTSRKDAISVCWCCVVQLIAIYVSVKVYIYSDIKLFAENQVSYYDN